jgi:hypothetical protein
MLSTIKRIAFELPNGELAGEIVREGRKSGKPVLKGSMCRDRVHWQTIEYFGGREDDRSLVSPK